jgi:hypothetical protein
VTLDVPPLTPSDAKGMLFEMVEVVTQLDDFGVKYAAVGVTVSPIVYTDPPERVPV